MEYIISCYSLHWAERRVDCKKLWDVVVGYIFWDRWVVEELQVGWILREHLHLYK